MTSSSPAMSVGAQSGMMSFSVYERGTCNIFIMDAGARGLSATAVSTNGAVLRPIDRAGAIGSKPRPGSAPSTSRARLATTAGTSCRCPSTHLQSAPSTTADTAAAVKIPGCIRCISAIPRWFVVMTCIPSRPANACRTRRASARHSTASLAAACWSETSISGFRLLRPFGASRRMYGPLPVELALFADGGVAWKSGQRPSMFRGTRGGVSSTGVTFRSHVTRAGRNLDAQPYKRTCTSPDRPLAPYSLWSISPAGDAP